MKVKIFGISMDLEFLIVWLLKALGNLIDHFVPGEELSLKEKKAVRTADYLGKEWGVYFAEKTETEIDDEAVNVLLAQTKDAAEEGSFELPIVPEIENSF